MKSRSTSQPPATKILKMRHYCLLYCAYIKRIRCVKASQAKSNCTKTYGIKSFGELSHREAVISGFELGLHE